MPMIQTFDGLTAASDAVGAYAERKRQSELDAQAQRAAQAQQAAQEAAGRRADAQIAIEQQKSGLQQKQFDADQQQTVVQNAAAAAKAELDARREADTALHQAREDALAAARERDAKVKNDRAYALSVKTINEKFAEKKAELKNARDVAQIHAAAATGAAEIRASAEITSSNIRAGATLQAAELRESGADWRARARNELTQRLFTQRDLTTRRGQSLTADTRTAATNASNHRAAMNAVLKLGLQKGAPKPPTPEQDPKFAQAMQQFMIDSPADRAALIANPNVPPETRAYFQALSGVLGTEPADATIPGGGDDDP